MRSSARLPAPNESRYELDEVFPGLQVSARRLDDCPQNLHPLLDFSIRNDPYLLEKTTARNRSDPKKCRKKIPEQFEPKSLKTDLFNFASILCFVFFDGYFS